MKKRSQIPILFYLVIIFFCGFQCKKDSPTSRDVQLKKKTLPEIKYYLIGKWQLHYLSGGLCATCPPQIVQNIFYQFLNDTIKVYNHDSLILDTAIIWVKPNVFGDTSWVMTFYDRVGLPNSLTPDGIYNDTLILYQPGSDGSIFHLTKSN